MNRSVATSGAAWALLLAGCAAPGAQSLPAVAPSAAPAAPTPAGATVAPLPAAVPPAAAPAARSTPPTPLVGYRRPGGRWRALDPALVPAGFVGPGRSAALDRQGDLWYLEAGAGQPGWRPLPAAIHATSAGTIADRLPAGDSNGSHHLAIWPGAGLLRADFELDDVSTLRLVGGPGRPSWTKRVPGSVLDDDDLQLSPRGEFAWFSTFRTDEGSAWHVVRPDGQVAERTVLDPSVVAGVRPDGTLVLVTDGALIGSKGGDPPKRATEPAERCTIVPITGPIQTFDLPRHDLWFAPELDADGRLLWQTADQRVQRLDDAGRVLRSWNTQGLEGTLAVRGRRLFVVDDHATPPRAMELPAEGEARPIAPADLPEGRVELPDGGAWESRRAEGVGELIRVDAAGQVQARHRLAPFTQLKPLGQAGGKLWIAAAYGDSVYYGAIDPAAPPAIPSPAPGAAPAGDLPELEGRWVEVYEDAPAGPFDFDTGTCMAASRSLAFAKAAAGGYEAREGSTSIATHRVTAGKTQVALSPSRAEATTTFSLRYDPATQHLYGEEAGGRLVRFARLAGYRACDDPRDK